MNGIKVAAMVCCAALVVGIAFAALADPMLTTFFAVFDRLDGWPFVITLDLMVGFLFFSFVIYLVVNLDRISARLAPAA